MSRLRWVLVFLAATLLVVALAFAYLYRGYRDQLDTELGQRLVAVASASAAAVNGDSWLLLAVGDSLTIQGVRADLSRVRETTGVSNIFLLDEAGITRFDLAGRYPVGEPNLAVDQDLIQFTHALAGSASYTELTSTGGAFLKTGYAPVWNDAGVVVGAVGVEASAAFLDLLARVRGTLLGAGFGVVLGLTLLGLGFARLLGAQEKLETRLHRTETLATMGQMAAMLAHEIRNPLGIIRGAAERVGARHGLADDEVLAFIPEEVDRLEATLSAYLEFARPEGAGTTADLRVSLERTLRLLSTEFERKGIRMTVDMEEGGFPVAAEDHFLQQTALNLLLNAKEAMSEGGTLELSLRRDGGRAVCRVRDTGQGMSEAVRRRATEPFFTSKEKGSGLGLAVVRRVMDAAGGRLDIRSVEGEGTTVTLTFPLAKSETKEPA